MIKSSATTVSRPGATPAPPADSVVSAGYRVALGILAALVVGSIVGSVGLIQSDVARWCAAAILICWTVSGVGAPMVAVVHRKPPPQPDAARGVHV